MADAKDVYAAPETAAAREPNATQIKAMTDARKRSAEVVLKSLNMRWVTSGNGRAMKVDKAFVDSVIVGKRHRALDTEKVKTIAESMAAIGLQQPITIWVDKNEAAHLIAGRHRLEAARSLGWEEIDASIVKMTPTEREMWEIAENLHRADLTALERDEHVARWVELAAEKVRQSDEPVPGGKQKTDKGQAKAARELGISEPDARRAVKVAKLSDEAKAAARETNLDDNRTALLEAAAETEPAGQVNVLKKRSASPAVDRQDRDVAAVVSTITDLAQKLQPPATIIAFLKRRDHASRLVDQDLDRAVDWLAEFARLWRDEKSGPKPSDISVH